ncbi:MAG: TetR/AcrR family transcriptional regulator [Hyphomicrobiales bacterium]|nr:MAG: TetR/AcrR family transcriptional regulator [Hyphomicrobiales bacterium]
MKDDAKAERHSRIAAAAYEVIEEKGYLGTSMLAIARRAKASNETLYNWYGDKAGLFRALIDDNAEIVRERIVASLEEGDDLYSALAAFGPVLLGMLLGKRAVALNRAAAADPSGELGGAIARGGRDAVAPLLVGLFARHGTGALRTAEEAAGTYIALLVADRQIRRVIGAMPEPTAEQCAEWSTSALATLKILMAGSPS